MSEELKKCPYCAEMVPAEAKKCKFCGEILDVTMRELEMLKQQNNNSGNGPIIVNNNNNNNNNNDNNIGNNIGSIQYASKSRTTYIILALFLGALGIHNFYAGRSGAGITQLLITLFLGWLVVPVIIVELWSFIEMFVVKTDGRGVPFA